MTLPTPDPDIWITGLGAATPLGHTFDAISDALLAGRSGIRPIASFPVDDQASKIAGLVGPIPCPDGLDPAIFAAKRSLEQLVLWCCSAALRDAGLDPASRDGLRIALVLGLGAEWLITWEGDGHASGSPQVDAPRPAEPLVETARRTLDLSGPTQTLSAACASGNHALAHARRWLQLGWADVCLAGACDMSVTPMSLACFGNLRTLSRRNDAPATASRPFDRSRDGFVIGEGGVVFVLERASDARARDASPYAAFAGFGASSDAHHPVIPSPDPAPAAHAVRTALADAGLDPAAISYVNAHAPGTPLGDALESAALRDALGESASSIPLSSTKSMTGHLLTAAGAFEALACLTALRRQAVPPTINLVDLDPACIGLAHVPLSAIDHPVSATLSNSFGFGGSNTCLILKAP